MLFYPRVDLVAIRLQNVNRNYIDDCFPNYGDQGMDVGSRPIYNY